jgi:membrane associated rhomboid family serine protease
MAGSFLQRPLRYSYYNATIVLIAVNVLVFLVTQIISSSSLVYMALVPAMVVRAGAWWQLITYMFVHANFWHIFFNMLALFLFGTQLEQRMGSTEFLLYYFTAGIGAGLATVFINYNSGMANVPVVGASGAIFALLLAFASYFPDARIFIFGILPMRAPVAVGVFALIELFYQFTGLNSGVAHLAHLSGLLFGYLYLVVRLGMNPLKIFFRR